MVGRRNVGILALPARGSSRGRRLPADTCPLSIAGAGDDSNAIGDLGATRWFIAGSTGLSMRLIGRETNMDRVDTPGACREAKHASIG